MANSKIYLGNTNIGSLFQGASDVSIYLGENKVYPLEWRGKFYAKYSGGETYRLECDGNTTLTASNTKPSGYEYSAMTDAVLGDCVTSIGDSAFNYCRGLTSCTIGSGVTSIGNNAFGYCSSLASIDIPSGVTYIASNSFSYCYSLTSCTIGSGVTSIGNSAFDGCRNLRRLNSDVDGVFNIPRGITKIESSSFWGCRSLVSIDIPSGVTSIGNSAFGYCRSLTSIDIPSGVTYIGAQALWDCRSLTSVTVNAVNPPTLGIAAFPNCSIYVPAESVNAYKSASRWSDYASMIKPISQKP